jgi:hypothetical protein
MDVVNPITAQVSNPNAPDPAAVQHPAAAGWCGPLDHAARVH